MGMSGITPTMDITGGNAGWGSGLGAFGGALIGSWFGDGWGGNYGRRGEGAVVADTALLDAINGVATSVNNANTANIQGQAALQNATNQGFSGVNTSILTTSMGLQNSTNQGFAGLNNAITVGDAGIQSALCQGFSGVNTAVLTSSRDEIQAIKDCCCETQKTIIAEGCATRELINSNYLRSVETQLCDAKAKNAQLESNLYVDERIRQQTGVILAHVK